MKFRPPTDDADFIKSLAKGLAVIEAFGPESPSMSLSAIAQKIGLSPGSARRVLVTLSELGYVHFIESERRYELAARTLQLGYAYLNSLPEIGLIKPRLAELSAKLDESLSLMALDGREVVCIARATAKRLARDYMGVGTRFPANTSPGGKLLLSALPEKEFRKLYDGVTTLPVITPFTVGDMPRLLEDLEKARQQGWVYANQETALGMASLSVPIRVGNRIRYALSTSANLNLDRSAILERYLPEMLSAAELIASSLSARS